MRILLTVTIIACSGYAQVQDGLSYWWLEDGKIDNRQKEDLDALEDDKELWCALAELWVGQEEAASADCAHEPEPQEKKKPPKKQRIYKGNISAGASIDSMGDFQKHFLQTNLHLWKAFAEARLKENNITAKLGYNAKNISIKAGDLLKNARGIYGNVKLFGINLGATYLRKENKNTTKDTAWIFGKYNANFLEKKFFAGVNITNLWSRTWQGIRYQDWTLQTTQLALVGKANDSIAVSAQITRKRKNAGIKLEWNEKRMVMAAGLKPGKQTADSIWAEARHPLRMRIGWNRNNQTIRLSQSLTVKESFSEKTPLEFRQESHLKIPLPLAPNLTLRHTLKLYPSQKISMNQFYIESNIKF